MTDLDLGDASMAGLVAWYSLIHIPDDEMGSVLKNFRRVLRPGGPLLLSFHVGDDSRLKTRGYGGHPMKVAVHRRRPGHVAARLRDAGFTVQAEMTLTSAESALGGILFARRPDIRYGRRAAGLCRRAGAGRSPDGVHRSPSRRCDTGGCRPIDVSDGPQGLIG
jgi:hypothetical protein